MTKFLLALLFVMTTALAPSAERDVVSGDVGTAIARISELPDPIVKQQISDFIESASPTDISKILAHIAITRAHAARGLVVNQLGHSEPLVLDRALQAMAAIGFEGDEDRQAVAGMLRHENVLVAQKAAACLGASGDLKAIPALAESLSNDQVKDSSVTALKRLTNADLPDKDAWLAWYDNHQAEVAARLSALADKLNSGDKKQQLMAIQVLGGSLENHQEVTALLEPMLLEEDQEVALAARQALAKLAPEQYSMPTAEELAAARPPVPVTTAAAVVSSPPAQGFFDSWFGMLVTVIVIAGTTVAVVYLLRSPPEKKTVGRVAKVVVSSPVGLGDNSKPKKPIGRLVKKLPPKIAK